MTTSEHQWKQEVTKECAKTKTSATDMSTKINWLRFFHRSGGGVGNTSKKVFFMLAIRPDFYRFVAVWRSGIKKHRIHKKVNYRRATVPFFPWLYFDYSSPLDCKSNISLSRLLQEEAEEPFNHVYFSYTVVGHKLYQARQIFVFNFSILLWLNHKR